MNTSQGALYFGAGIDLQQWRRDIDSMRRDIVGLGQTVSRESQNMDSSFKNLSIGIASYFSASALKGFVMELINVRGEFQKTEIAFATMIGDAGKAQALMGQMVDLAAKTPFSLQDVSSGAKQLLAFQIPANQVVDTLTRLGNIAAGLSVPLARINLVYGQVKAKGKLMGDDLRQFTEAGIPMVAELAKKFGKTTAEISSMVSAGKIGFKDVKDVLFSMTDQGGMFFNLMEKQSKSLSGQVANLGDAWDQMLNKIGEGQEGVLSDGIQGLIYLVEHYQDVGKALLTLIEIYGAYRTALIVTSLLQTRMVTPAIIQGFANLIKMIRGATVAQDALNAASLRNPYVLLATLIAALIAVTYNYRTEIGELIGIIEKQTTAQKAQEAVMTSYNDNFGKGVSQTKASIAELINIIRNENSSLAQRKQAYERLIAIDPTFRGTLDAQFRATRQLGDALDYVIGKIDAFAMAQAKAAAARKYLEESFEEQFKAGALKTQVLDADAEAKRLRKMSDDAEKAGKANLSYLRKAIEAENKRDILAKKWREQQNISNEKSSIANTIIRNNNTEIAQKEKQLAQLEREIKLGKDSGEVLELKKKRAEKLAKELSGFKPEVIQEDEEKAPNLGWAGKIKAQIDDLEAQLDSAPTRAAYNKIKAKIKELNDLLNPKTKKDNKQIAEIIPEGSIEELQRRASLLQKAYDTAADGVVKLRTVDKYGNDKDKKGNPYLTGEVISSEEASKRLEEINNQIKAKQFKSYQERIDEGERQWNNYYKIAQFYGKETADAQYQELFKGVKNYLQFLENQEQALKSLADQGIISDQQKQDLIFLQDKIRSLNGTETPLEGFKRGIDDSLKKLPSLVDQLEFLEKAEDSAFEKAGGNSQDFLEKKLYFTEQKKNILQTQQDTYSEFLKEQRTFEERKLAIEKEYDLIRDKIAKDKTTTPEQKTSQTENANKQQAKDISSMSLELFQKTDLWVQAFGDLDKIGPKTLKRIRLELQKFLESGAAGALKPEDLKVVQDAYDKLDDTIKSRNPFEAIGIAVNKYAEEKKKLSAVEKKYGKDSVQYEAQLENVKIALGKIFEVSGAAIQGLAGFAAELGGALGVLSQDAQEALKNAQQLFDGIINAVVGYTTGDYAKMAGGLVQIITSVSKAMNGDVDRAKDIKLWGIEIEKLKSLYEQLNKVIEKTAGEAQLKMQRDLIANLKEQQDLLVKMRRAENDKKGSDTEKIASYNQQIEDINNKIVELADNFKNQITTIEFKDLSQNMADALIEAFGKGEDAAKAFDKVVDDVMRNAVANALRMKILEPVAQDMVDQLYNAMGFGKGDVTDIEKQLVNAQDKLKQLNDLINNSSPLNADSIKARFDKEEVEKLINSLKQRLSDSEVSGGFDGLTPEERDRIKAMGEDAMKKYMDALKQYQDLFGQSAENAQGLKGDIKGITEKTAGALEGQFNAVRINIAAVLKIMQTNQTVSNSQTLLLSKIEGNTYNLHQMRKDLAELNSKVKNSLAGIP